MIKNLYFDKLKDLIHKNKLEIIILISPPRANSTLLEVSLLQANDVGVCHEPFSQVRKDNFNPDDGYKNIYDSFYNKKTGKKFKKIVVKEMAQWVVINSEYKRLLTLTNFPVIFIIRNPLLCIESRIKKVLNALALRPGLSLQQFLFQKLSNINDFNFHDYLYSVTKTRKVELRTFALDLNYDISQIKTYPNLDIQNFLLDTYAQVYGYSDWRNLLAVKLEQEGDFNFFTEILKVNTNRVDLEKDEFYGLFEIYNFSVKQHISCYVYDTTEIRLFPKSFISDLCDKLNINYNDSMVNWGANNIKNFNTGQNKTHEKIWYEKLMASTKINLPNEVPKNILKFPFFMQEYLVKVNYPVYFTMSKYKVKLKSLQAQIQASMKDIDPVYLAINIPELCCVEEFINKNLAYKDELLMIKKINEENLEIKKINGLSEQAEYVDIVDERNNTIGTTTAKEAHEKKLTHRAVGVLLFDIHENLYFQSGAKYNLLDLSAEGHVNAGESCESAAHRKVFEKIGLKTKLKHVSTFCPVSSKFGHFWSVYKAIKPVDWVFKPTNEVPDLVKINLKDVIKKTQENPELFTYGFLNVFNEYLSVNNKGK